MCLVDMRVLEIIIIIINTFFFSVYKKSPRTERLRTNSRCVPERFPQIVRQRSPHNGNLDNLHAHHITVETRLIYHTTMYFLEHWLLCQQLFICRLVFKLDFICNLIYAAIVSYLLSDDCSTFLNYTWIRLVRVCFVYVIL